MEVGLEQPTGLGVCRQRLSQFGRLLRCKRYQKRSVGRLFTEVDDKFLERHRLVGERDEQVT